MGPRGFALGALFIWYKEKNDMAGFFPHIGVQTSAFTPLAKSTFDTILTDIVTDVGVGVNGWTVHDDQKSNVTALYSLPKGWGGADYPTMYTNNYCVFTNGSTSVTSYNNYGYSGYRHDRNLISSSSLTPNPTQITLDGGSNYYTVVAVANNNSSFTIDRNFAQGSINTARIQAKCQGYVVLKCTSAQKTFYVQILRPASFADVVMVKTWETWNALTHTGTGGGPMEVMRGFTNNVDHIGSTKVQYILWLLPDVFGLWCGGDSTELGTKSSDFMYIGNMTPSDSQDKECLFQACTNQDYSGVCLQSSNNCNGGAAVFRGVNGGVWTDPVATFQSAGTNNLFDRNVGGNAYEIWPKGQVWYWNPNRMSFNNYGKFQCCSVEVYATEKVANTSSPASGLESKRGELKYVKFPASNPTSFHLVQLSPADDDNTYIIVKTSYPVGESLSGGPVGPTKPMSSTSPIWSGWGYANKNQIVGDYPGTDYNLTFFHFHFLMPTNI